jgi:hypothetical protein
MNQVGTSITNHYEIDVIKIIFSFPVTFPDESPERDSSGNVHRKASQAMALSL